MPALRSICLCILTTLAVAAIWAPGALSATPRQQQYGNPTPAATPPSSHGAVNHVLSDTASAKGGLPFTGLQLGTAVALSLGLVAGGLGARRLGKQKG